LYAFFTTAMCAIHTAHLILLYFIVLIILGEKKAHFIKEYTKFHEVTPWKTYVSREDNIKMDL
jgi:hypothetical protein